jgi:four helix bundle protein
MGRNFRNLNIYQLSYDFLLEVYGILPLFPEQELRNMHSQLQRAATSVVLNIVEGCSNKSNKVFLNHLQYSYGSCQEIDVLLKLACDLNYIDKETYEVLHKQLDHIKGKVFKFMQTIDKELFFGRNNYNLN